MSTRPEIVSRSAWGAATKVPQNTVPNSSRRFLVIHWPVMGARDEKQWCRDIERMHRNQGWSTAPGYNFLVGMSGTIYEGAGVSIRGIHSPPHNVDGWGVCVLQPSTAAGVPSAPITDAAKVSTVALYNWLSGLAGRQLSRWYHGKDYATACPGPDLRRWVEAGMPAPSTSPPPPPPPAPVIAVGRMPDGRFEIFRLAGSELAHRWHERTGGWIKGWHQL